MTHDMGVQIVPIKYNLHPAPLAALVDLLSMPYLHNRYDKKLIHHFIYDSVHTQPDSVALLSREFLTAHRAGILLQRLHALKNAGNIFVWDWTKVFRDGVLEYKPIACHEPSNY